MKISKFNALIIGLIIALNITAISASFTTTIEVSASFEDNDLAQFLTVSLSNVTASIDPATAPAGMNYKLSSTTENVIKLDTAIITAGTIAYDRSDFEQQHDYSSFHKVSESQVREALALEQLSAYSSFSTLKILSTSVANDSSEAAGENFVSTEKYSVSDFEADTHIETNSSHYTTWPAVEAKYQYFAAELAENATADMFVSDADEEFQGQLHVSTLDDVEETILSILKENIAANYSTAADIIVPSRVHILDYNFNASNPTAGIIDIYISENFQNQVREAADEYIASELRVKMKVFGIEVSERTYKNAAVSFALLDDALGGVVKFGEVIISTPLNLADGAIATVVGVAEGTVDTAMSIGTGIADACLSAPAVISKTSGDAINAFTSTTGLGANLGGALGTGGKLIGDGLSSIVGGVGGIFSSIISALPLILILGGGALIIGLIVYKKFVMGAPGEYEPY